jgi:Rrf2 family protein
MVRLSRKVEYGLIAIRHIAATQNGHVLTAREIADAYGISYELLAKVLQRLARSGLIVSHQGVRGGYTLARDPVDIPVARVIAAIEGSASGITRCITEGPESCTVFSVCTIKDPLQKVQANIERAFESMTVAEIV